jgi:hypothetical protein
MARFEEIGPNLGVDSALPGHAWMMVPKDGANLVRLTDGAGFDVPTSVGGRLAITDVTAEFHTEVHRVFGPLSVLLLPNARVFRVRGLTAGESKIVATKGAQRATLAVSVHRRPKPPLAIAFFYLQDRTAAGRVTPRTGFDPSTASGWVADLNTVFGRQANIWFSVESSTFLPLAGLGEWVGGPGDLAAFAAARAKSKAQITVFLAGPRIVTLDHSEPFGFHDVNTKVIVVQDQFVTDPWAGRSAPMLKTIAHEIGHHLNHAHGAGQGHEFFKECGYTSDILNTLDGRDIKIPRQRVLDWNPW